MPELPDVELYLTCLRRRVVGRTIASAPLRSVSALRTFEPPYESIEGAVVENVTRLGKRVVFRLDGDRFLAIHLMITGRFRWTDAATTPPRPGRDEHARWTFEDSSTLRLVEAGRQKRAAIHLVTCAADLALLDPGGLEVLDAPTDVFTARLREPPGRTVKRALTEPNRFAGVGNAYSDEILHRAGMSPLKRTRDLDDEGCAKLHEAIIDVMREWTERLYAQFKRGEKFPGPGQVTAFRPEMAVHGKYGEPCPVCATPVARIVKGENEMNYCPGCQTEGRLLRDRALSRLLRDEWPGDG